MYLYIYIYVSICLVHVVCIVLVCLMILYLVSQLPKTTGLTAIAPMYYTVVYKTGMRKYFVVFCLSNARQLQARHANLQHKLQ